MNQENHDRASHGTASPDPVRLIETWPVGAAAAAWSRPDGTVQSFGPVDARFKLASVTKPLFAFAVLIASEEGTLALNSALGPARSTVSHLLAHASGLGPERSDAATTPGTRRIYSNGGFKLLGEALTSAAGMAAEDYMYEAVCEPLGMTSTMLNGSPAHGGISSVNDLVRFCREWLKPTLLASDTVTNATTPFLPQLDGVLPGYGRQSPNPWGLGVEIRGSKSPHWTGTAAGGRTFGHFGAAGTFFWIDPATGQFAVCLTDTAFGPWALERWTLFNDAVLQEFVTHQ